MKVVVLLCAVVCSVSGGAVVWPGAVPFANSIRTVIPPQVKGFAYSTSQYINAVPPSYAIGYQPQVSYPLPQFGVYPSYAGIGSYQPVLAPSYYPGSGLLYPAPSPIVPPIGLPARPFPPIQGQPSQISPISPSQETAGDEDTTVIDSAEFALGQRGQQQPGKDTEGFQSPSSTGSYDTKNMPGFPQIQQSPEFTQIQNSPQIAQAPQRSEIPQTLSIPEVSQMPSIPQFPPVSGNGFPQFAHISQGLQFQPNQPFQQISTQTQTFGPQSGLTASTGNTQKLNDEDTIAVESA